jgi:hypothetical protein
MKKVGCFCLVFILFIAIGIFFGCADNSSRQHNGDIKITAYVDNQEYSTIYTSENDDYTITLPVKPDDITTNPNLNKYFYGWFLDKNYQNELTEETKFYENCSIYGKFIYISTSDFSYTVSEAQATITSYNNMTSTMAIIPSIINSFPVTSIGNNAFKNKTMLRNVVILDGIETIGDSSFLGCNSMVKVVIPNTVTSIGNSAFENCTLLKQVKLPEAITSIGDNAFKNCDRINDIELSSNIENIGLDSFTDCDNLKTISYLGTLENWFNKSFAKFGGFLNLENLYINNEIITTDDIVSYLNNANTIPNYTFYNAKLLSNIIIPENVSEIGRYVFAGCESLKSVIIPNNVKSIGDGAFNGCSSLESITLPFIGASTEVSSSDVYQYPFGYIFGTNVYDGNKSIL